MRALVTGAAGFIGFHVAKALLERGCEVVGLDNRSPYYDVSLKDARLAQLAANASFEFIDGDLVDPRALTAAFAPGIDRVVHLAAQPGVRYSIDHPESYAASNLSGFLAVLEGCRHHGVEHLVYASSSSVYGANRTIPFSTAQSADHPLSLYAATKRANELMAHAYSHLYGLPTTGLRFFTVYGPWGRPDMAYFSFTRDILAKKPIQVFNEGRLSRDFTYIDDVVRGVVRVLDKAPTGDPHWDSAHPDPASSSAPYRLYNIGNRSAIDLLEFIRLLESELETTAVLELLPMQPGDVLETRADVDDLARDFDFAPSTTIAAGLKQFVSWYRSYFGET